VLEDAWRAAPHPDIARAYARLVDGETAQQRLTRVETRLGSLRPDHPELRVALGELAIAAQNWDKARTELQRALALEPTERVYRLLAEVERGAGNPARAQEWLAQAVDAQPDRAWVCEDTGEALPEWRPFGASGRFDVVRWGTPPRVATLAGREHGAFLVAEGPPSPPPATEPAVDAAAPPGLGGVDVQAKPAEAEGAKPTAGDRETAPQSAAA
jgi:HemY protein